MKTRFKSSLMGVAAASLALLATAPVAQAGKLPYQGEIMVTIDDICPAGWLPADGRVMRISQNTALFALLGISFGGDGISTFNLPDLRGRTVVGAGFGSSGDHPLNGTLAVGAKGGAESTTLTFSQILVQTNSNVKPGPPSGEIVATQQITPAPTATLPTWIGLTACIATSGRFPEQN
jgi:microcystin-dependent protein